VLGRNGESLGTIRQRLRVTLAGHPLHDQELSAGPAAGEWDGPAVLGGRRAMGAVLVVDPEWASTDDRRRPTATTGTDAALLPLDGPAVLVTAMAHDALTLRRRLDSLLTSLDRGS
jgi:urease accessory protein